LTFLYGQEVFSYFADLASYSLPEAILMKDPVLILSEYHPPVFNSTVQSIRETVTAWLTKEIHK